MTDLLNVVYLFLNYVRIFRKLIDKLASADGITRGGFILWNWGAKNLGVLVGHWLRS